MCINSIRYEATQVSSKRRQSIKKEGYNSFIPDYPPSFKYGKVLTGSYDKECFLEGYHKAEREHASLLKGKLESARQKRIPIDVPPEYSEKLSALFMEVDDATCPPFLIAVLKSGEEKTVFELKELQ